MPEQFYIEYIAHPGNCRLWWKVDGAGYTTNLDRAWLVGKEQAERICTGRPDQDVMRSATEMVHLAERHVRR